MGLLTKLTTTGSPFSPANGGNISTNPLATKTSTLHSNGTTGYSLDGADAAVVNTQYASYRDGAPNVLPQPTTLDVNGAPYKYMEHLPL
jgi:ABC-type metal ion transport system substrate-binding protein